MALMLRALGDTEAREDENTAVNKTSRSQGWDWKWPRKGWEWAQHGGPWMGLGKGLK